MAPSRSHSLHYPAADTVCTSEGASTYTRTTTARHRTRRGAGRCLDAVLTTRHNRLMGESWASNAVSRRTMQRNRRRDTGPELAVRRQLHHLGLRYRVDYPIRVDTVTRPDVVFTRAKVAVFVDGCFWHSCPTHATTPVSNHVYWDAKLRRNRERDIEQTAALARAGWTVLRFWEHEDVSQVVRKIEAALGA